MTKKKKYILISISVLLLLTIFIGISYAYWKISYTQTTSNKIATSCFSMELSNEKNDITLDSAYPISDEKGKSLTPYSFTITNTCDLFASYTINLEMLEGTTLNSKYIKTMINNEAITNLNTLDETDTSIDGAIESRVLFKGSLGSGDSTDYTFRLWMDSETPATDDAMNKIFQAKITIIAEVSNYSPVENGFTNLADALLVNEYQTTSLDIAKDRIASKQEVDFKKSAPNIEWKEVIASSATTTYANLPHPDLINSGIKGTSHLTTSHLYPRVGTGYTFNNETGLYDLENVLSATDPTTLDYENNDYYYCSTKLNIGINGPNPDFVTQNCFYIFKISNITVKESQIESTWKSNIYTIEGYKYSSTESESDKTDKGIYTILDDYGESYYYRGSVTNNYVKFAGYYWRILRINGDGSIRLLYSGTTNSNDYTNVFATLTDNTFGYNNTSKLAYNLNKIYPAFVGYKYGNITGESYESVHKNETDSNIKKYLDIWYKQNILDKGYSSYIADSGFCNDRSLYTEDGYSVDKYSTFGGYYRYRTGNLSNIICLNADNDLFTINGNTKGNGALTYPIGLITIDEFMLSGYRYNNINKYAFTYTNQGYWTMSPVYFSNSSNSAGVYTLLNSGKVDDNHVHNINDGGVRPVINLKADTQISGGIGTANDPFIIKTN